MENIVGKYASYFAHLINVWKLILANAMAFAHVTGLLKRAGSLRGFAEAVAECAECGAPCDPRLQLGTPGRWRSTTQR